MMPPEVKKYLSRNIQSQFDKDPAIQSGEVKKWLLSGNQPFDLSTIKSNTLSKFISYQLEKLRNTGNLTRKRGSGGHNKTPPRVVNRIKRLALNKHWRGSRKVAAMVGVTRTTVQNYLRKSGAKAYHRRKVQAMTPVHQARRVEFSRWALREYGRDVTGHSVWGRLVNTDFSAMVKKNGNLNSKNHVVWSRSLAEAGDLVEFVQEKFEDSFMVWGGISLKGLVPPLAPIFVVDLKAEWARMGNQLGRGVTGPMYAHMITSQVVDAVRQIYGNWAVWQDDPARIHRTPEALQACSAFPRRIPHERQAPKMADVWPIEQVWAILKEKVMQAAPRNKAELKRVITRSWREIDQDKEMIRNLISSIPKRLQAVIDVDGRQITKEDY